ncbi:helix-turn-helix domain-containing protein [Desulforhopalus singaporensis]|nr:cupin domain-containing protein [Desulforhopalus singaporensis]
MNSLRGITMQLSFSEKLRQARKNNNLTIEQLANMVGCSKSYISQLENDATKPSVTMLGKLVEALGVPITDFFQDNRAGSQETEGEMETSPAIIKSESLVKKGSRRTINYPDGKTKSHFLTRAVYQKKMQPILTVIEPGGDSNNEEKIVHPVGSEEFLMVVKGEIEFEVAGETYIMEEGDSFYFNGNTPHRWRNSGDETAEVLFVWTPAVW